MPIILYFWSFLFDTRVAGLSLPAALYLQIFGTKPLPLRRFLQHYYRDTFIESHRKPLEVPQISYSGRLICSTPILQK